MRIIIEIEDESETTTEHRESTATTEVRRETDAPRPSRDAASDAGRAPRNSSPVPDEYAEPGLADTGASGEGATDAGGAPGSLSGTRVDPSGNGAPTRASEHSDAQRQASSMGRATVRTMDAPRPSSADPSAPQATRAQPGPDPQEGTDMGPPPASIRAESATPARQAVDYEEIVSGTVDEVKERVRERDLNVDRVIQAERSGDARTTLLEWLENRAS